MVDDDSDETLGVRLDSALRAGLDLTEVDVATLLRGSRHRARRVRAQRVGAGVAAAVLVVAAPIGYEVLGPEVRGTVPPAAMLPSSTSLSTKIPDAFAFNHAELPTGLTFELEAGNAGGAIVDGQVCDSAQKTSGPLVTRRWVWSSSPGKADNRSVSLTVTGWAEGKAETAFTAAVDGTGNCTWEVPQTRHTLPEASAGLADQSWAATSKVDGRHFSCAVIRIGDGIVGVQVQDPKSAESATELAETLVKIQATRLDKALNGSG